MAEIAGQVSHQRLKTRFILSQKLGGLCDISRTKTIIQPIEVSIEPGFPHAILYPIVFAKRAAYPLFPVAAKWCRGISWVASQ
jgi:hypothetical protein